MSTFDQLSGNPAAGALFYFAVSLDGGITYTKIYTTSVWENPAAGFVWEPRLKQIGNFTRELGPDRGFVASSMNITLENTDGGVDWVCDRSSYQSQGIKSVWKYICTLWDPLNQADYDSKTLGYFTLMEGPTRNNTTVEITLVDAGLGKLSQLSATPSIRDWAYATDAGRPFTYTKLVDESSKEHVPNIDADAPSPLMWGTNLQEVRRVYGNCYVICAVPGTAGALPASVDFVRLKDFWGITPVITSTAQNRNAINVWTVRRSADITKNGKIWHLLWFNLDLNDYQNVIGVAGGQFTDKTIRNMLVNRYKPDKPELPDYTAHALIAPVYVQGGLLSHPANDLNALWDIPASKIAYDIVTKCLDNIPTVIGYSAVAASRSTFLASGRIDQGVDRVMNAFGGTTLLQLTNGDAIQELRALASTGQFDLFVDWSGQLNFIARAADYASQTATVSTLDETMVADVSERIPSVGERNAPANRTFVRYGSRLMGPLDDATAIANYGRIVPRTVDGRWLLTNRIYSTNPTTSDMGGLRPTPEALDQFRSNDISTIRPTVTVVTGINGLSLELGQYTLFTWRRGTIGLPYTSAVFRVESISLASLEGKTQLQLSWADDLRDPTKLPYILDDETLSVRLNQVYFCNLTTGNFTVLFTSSVTPNLNTDGVVPGDVLLIGDSSESATGFQRNRTLIISAVSGSSVTVDKNDFGTGGPFVATFWKIYKGALTSNRESFYGKSCTGAGLFSNGSPANRILEG